MSDPYREQAPRNLQALLDEERTLLVGAGRVMVIAGVVGLVAVAVTIAMSIRASAGWFDWSFEVALPLLFSVLTLQAGVVLARLPGGSGDYGAIERAVSRLGIVYAVKGVIVLVFVGLAVIGFFLPMLLYWFG